MRDDSDAARWSIRGTVADLDGVPVSGLFVTASDEYCVPDTTGADGTFEVADVGAGSERMITYGDTAPGEGVASLVVPIAVGADLELPWPLLAPRLGDPVSVDEGATSEQVVEVAGVTLTIAPGSLVLAPFASSQIRGARVPAADAPAFIPGGVDLVDLVALDPIQSTFDPPAAAAFSADSGLAPGTSVAFWSLDYDTGLLVEVGTGSVGEDGRPATGPGVGLPELTWVGISVLEGS